ncbi:dienelactone hydrolase [Paucimonas lemoignei]|uniref:Dienelactone hydrolase n=1 Tax=Paucimonas lemoignei TaxID=29443 RepID=A0A4R3I0U3_PAULE|nr:CocE/NonD family hydrolase [Paucimonas lemoignei]TCS38603.1 dienelactone hydrolase [Paucimonas lemoignei]
MPHLTATPRSTARRLSLVFLFAFAAIPAMGLVAQGSIAQVPHAAAAAVATVTAPAPAAAPVEPQHVSLDSTLNEEIVMVPVHGQQVAWWTGKSNKSSGADVSAATSNVPAEPAKRSRSGELETTVYMPPGEGPFPILVLNHGKSLGNPRSQERARFLTVSREFVKRGYAVVIPMRTGFSKSSGEYVEEYCDMTANGQIQANDLDDVLAYVARQPWADMQRILVGGQSYGGLTAVAFATHNFPGVKGVINFAGGLKTNGCQWESSLVQAFATYGAQARVPSLWFYGENDSHFGPALASRMHQAYTAAGGNATLVKFGAFKNDAHGMSGSRDGIKIWLPETEKFLRQIGMPSEEIFKLAEPARLPKSGYAEVNNIAAVPYLREDGREQYRAFLTKSSPRAFALSSSGAWSWVEDGDDPADRAIANCQKNSVSPCKLYAVDGDVVWSDKV